MTVHLTDIVIATFYDKRIVYVSQWNIQIISHTQ